MPAELLYESDDCSGDAYIENLGLNRDPASEVFPQGFDTHSVVVAAGGASAVTFNRLIASSKDRARSCLPLGVAQEVLVSAAFEIDPTALGLVHGPSRWEIAGTLRVELERSNLIHCNGFEACPQQ
jgi:hypothetical protein